MPALEDYICAMEALPEAALVASGLAIPAWEAAGTGTCGVTTAEDGLALPLLDVTASGDWGPVGVCPLPLPEAMAATVLWHPAWGTPLLLSPQVAGQASPAIRVQAALTPFFTLARAGAAGAVVLGALAAAAVSTFDRTGRAACPLPAATAKAYACGLASPVTNDTASDAVVGLLCRGDAELAALAAAWAGSATGGDAVAARLLAAVAASVTYEDEPDGEDVWACALATAARGSGDCEDGAVLLHGLLLAAGIAADRLVTAFGRVGLDRVGHAWVAYRRESDGAWVALDWTLGALQGPVCGLPVLGESAYYALVDYALTAGAFFTVRQGAADFFARSAAGLALPAPSLDGAASLGARGGVSLATGWLAWAAGASSGPCRLPGVRMAATAGSVWAEAGWPAMLVAARTGATGAPTAGVPDVGGAAAGGSRGDPRLPRLGLGGRARLAVRMAGVLSLDAWRATARAAVGGLGAGDCILSRPLARLSGLGGALADGRVLTAPPVCLGRTTSEAFAAALALTAALTARAEADVAGAGRSFVYDQAAGEEWR
ncbi:MAG: transglutaminase domain-containing protein [Solidesulfovibrio sp.]|uniref:transglutaminase domain-containing protein n=1 Tax=Solidesulfovibrio sp. TaxID=2910990 RepID=UPI002B1FFEF3|nr:transglutaminase domain-containing protein [Solidesulfovibrio sp.]MEA4858280.1 transglutaminase domain-containing protein [Solidesulfovibrio sp.]